MWYIFIITILLMGIAYQDFKERQVHVFLLIGFVAINAMILLPFFGANKWESSIWLSISFLLINAVVLCAYIYFKTGKLSGVFDQFLGMGDVVFFLGLAFSFSFYYFLLFFTLSLLMILVSTLLLKPKARLIPLAGAQALVLLPIIYLDYFSTDFDRFQNFPGL